MPAMTPEEVPEACVAELEAFLRRFERDARDWEAAGRDPTKLWPDAAPSCARFKRSQLLVRWLRIAARAASGSPFAIAS